MKTESGSKCNSKSSEESTKILKIEKLITNPLNNMKITTNSSAAFNNRAGNFTAYF